MANAAPPPIPRRRRPYRSKSLISGGIALALCLVLLGFQFSYYLSHPAASKGWSLFGLALSAGCLGALLYVTYRIPLPLPRRCSFCGKPEAEVSRLIAGPGIHICANCVAICQAILDRDKPRSG